MILVLLFLKILGGYQMDTIGERIKYLRRKQGLSLQELADIIGKSKGNISGYENNKYEPSAQTILALAKYFKISTDWILSGEIFIQQEKEDHTRVLKSELEKNTFQMFSELEERDKEDIFEFIKIKHKKNMKKGNATKSSNSNTTSPDTKNDSGIA